MFSLFSGFVNKLFNTKKTLEIKSYDKSKCIDLASTAQLLASVLITGLDVHDPELVNLTGPEHIYPIFPQDVFNVLLEFVYPRMEPDTDQIDSMLLVARVLLATKYNHAYEEFLLNCPEQFMLAYANNSERTPQVLSELKSRQMDKSYNYILARVTPDRLITWAERAK